MRRALLVDLYALPEYDLSLALGYLKAFADADPGVKGSWDIRLLHLPVATPPGDVAAAVAREAPDLVGFSCYSWNIRAVEKALTRLPASGRPLVVLGGIEVTPDPAGYLRRNRNADLVVFGEGEETFREVLQRLAALPPGPLGASALAEVKGVCWRDGRKERRNAARPPIADLATVPSPYVTGAFGPLLAGQDRVMVETTRGCPYTCTFCFEPRGFARVRSFPADRVKEEMRAIAAAGVREVAFLDTNFNMDRKRAVEVWGFLAGLPGRIRYAFELRGELLDAEQARAISALDYFAEIGLQSVHERTLDTVKRWYDRARFTNGVRALLEAGIYRPCAFSAHGGASVDLMMGLPGETAADFLRSWDFVFAVGPSTIVITMTKILPGTELGGEHAKHGYVFDEDAQYEATSSRTLTAAEARDLASFRDASDWVYNRVHAVRTLAFTAQGLGIPPSEVVIEIGRLVAKSGRRASDLGPAELGPLLAEVCRARGKGDLGEKAVEKLSAENTLVALQRYRESKRTWWSRFVFAAGYRLLTGIGGLPPLPGPPPAAVRGEEPAMAATA